MNDRRSVGAEEKVTRMAKPMTKRERVVRTMALQETDRVPVYDLLRHDGAFAHFSGEKLPALAEDAETAAELNRIASKATGSMCDMTRSVGFGPAVAKGWTDELGLAWRSDPHEKTIWIAEKPFDDVPGAVAFMEQYHETLRTKLRELEGNPSAFREKWRQGFLDTQATLGETVDLLAQQGVGLDDIRVRLGIELFAYVDADQPGLIGAFLETCTDYQVAMCHVIADAELSPCVLTYGDIACKERLLHSPEWLRREFFPRLKRINDAWHEHGLKCLFHSDGYLMEIMDDLIESGIDGLNPIETVAGMNLREVKEMYGDRIFLAGGIDMSQLMSRGSPDDVREVCRQAIRDAYPGYFIGSTTEADNSCRLENILAMVEVAMETSPL